MSIRYIEAGDGTVVAWGEERDPPGRDRRWGASAWTSDPRRDGARHIDRLVADATYNECQAAIGAYLAQHRKAAIS